MGFDLKLNIPEDSNVARNIDEVVKVEHVSREEAAMRILGRESEPLSTTQGAELIGAFSSPEDQALVDMALAEAMKDRQRRNGQSAA